MITHIITELEFQNLRVQVLLVWYLVVVTSTKEDAAACGVPLDQTHSSAVAVQLQHCLHHVAPQTALWDLPYSHLRCPPA